MSLNEQNRMRIDEYIQAHSDAKTGEHFPISLKGKKQSLDVYRLPTDILFYNIKNGRFAAEYGEIIKKEGGHLEPEKEEDAEEIKKLLLEIGKGETQRTYNDLKIRGQWNCGIITVDGYLIDGNRRKAIISKLFAETGQGMWKYMDVARLSGPITAEDLWALEAGIQLGKDEIVRYGPINEMLKIREGKHAGLSEKQIVTALYGYDQEEEIHEKLDRLNLIERYLKFVNKPQQYSLVKNSVEHFINLQKIIKNCKARGYDPDRIVKIQHTTFQLISEGVPHLDIRKINQMIEKDLADAVSEIESAGEYLNGRQMSPPPDMNPDDNIPTPTKTKFINAADILEVNKLEGDRMRLLRRAEGYLQAVSKLPGSELTNDEASDLIDKINSHMYQIQKTIGKVKHDS